MRFSKSGFGGRRRRRSIRNDGWVHLRVFRCSETSLGGFEVNLLIGFSEIYILVREILKENYETLVWNASRSRGIGGRFAASKPCTAGSSYTRTSPPGHGAPKPFQSSRNSSGDPSHHANFESDHHHACVHDRSLTISIRVISIRSARSIPGELYPSLVNAGDVQEILLPTITSI